LPGALDTIAEKYRRLCVVFVLEFVVVAPNGRRDAVDYLKCRAPTVDKAGEKARSIARDVYVKDRNPDLCVIKDQMGTELAELAIETRPQ
jgi:hypothetical protein